MDTGNVWAAIRGELPWLRDELKQAVEAKSYEAESAILDGIARRLADAVAKRADRLSGVA